MSSSSTPATSQHFDYLATRTRPEPELLSELRAAALEEGLPPIWISPEQASFMQILLRATGAREVVEVGTLGGYSAIAMAQALPSDGRVRTIEISEKHADFARRWVERAGLSERVEVICAPGDAALPEVADRSVDAVFLDADKAGYRGYLEQALRFLRPGGLVLVDNAFAFGQLFEEAPSDGEVGAVRAFNEHMVSEQRVHSIIVPIGDGLWVGVFSPEEG